MSLCFETMISLLPVSFSNDRDYFFHPAFQINLTLYTHIIDYESSKILVKTTSD